MAIKNKFCPSCGKYTNNLHDSLCSNCYIDSSSISIPKKVSMKFCPVCKSALVRYVWVTPSKPIGSYIEQYIASKIKLSPLEKLKNVKILKLDKDGEIEIISELNSKNIKRNKKINLEIQKFSCPQCSRQFKASVVAKIQLRTKDNAKKFVSDILSYIKQSLNIVGAKEHLHGIDISFSDNHTARVLMRRLKDRFKCSVKESVKQRGWNKIKNRPLMQVTYILRQK